MGITFKELPALFVIGYPAFIHRDNVHQEIPPLWEKLRNTKLEIKNQVSPPQCIGLEYYESNFMETQMFWYMPAFIVQDLVDIPMMMCAKSIPASFYAIFTHRGPISNIHQSFNYFYNEWLPASDYEMRLPYDFEFYDERFNGMDENSALDIYVPVRQKI